jgi:hypothetical protein
MMRAGMSRVKKCSLSSRDGYSDASLNRFGITQCGHRIDVIVVEGHAKINCYVLATGL